MRLMKTLIDLSLSSEPLTNLTHVPRARRGLLDSPDRALGGVCEGREEGKVSGRQAGRQDEGNGVT